MQALANQYIHKSSSYNTSVFYQGLLHLIDMPRISRTNILVAESPVIHALSDVAKQAVSKINKFSSLQANWDGYGAVVPTKNVIDAAINFIRETDKRGLAAFFVAPGPNGEILVEFQNGDRSVEMYFYVDSLADYAFFDDDELVEEQNFDENVIDKIAEFIG